MDPVSEPPPFDALEDRILPWSQVRVICGLSRTTVWRMQKSGDFPACVQEQAKGAARPEAVIDPDPGAKTRRKRKAAVAENQTAFDFGG